MRRAVILLPTPARRGRHLLHHLRLASSTTNSPPLPASHLLPPDVEPLTGLCADGLVRIMPCAANPDKGLGAFAEKKLSAGLELGEYRGEVLTMAEYFFRYEGASGYEEANRRAQWMQDRTARGIGISGQYVLMAGTSATTGKALLLDAEDVGFASWTRFINHSERDPNLEMLLPTEPIEELEDDKEGATVTPLVRLLARRDIEPGEELTFNYGEDDDSEVAGVLGFDER